MDKNLPVNIILLGASNLSRGYYGLTRCIKKNLHPQPVVFLNAIGPGRAYCARGGVFNASYPPIGSIPIVSELEKLGQNECHKIVLLSDIGNDIGYGIPAKKIIIELEKIVGKFEDMQADILICPIPSTLINKLTPQAFKFLKAIFFPRSEVTLSEALESIQKVNNFVKNDLCGRVTVINGLESYISLDLIHYGIFNFGKVWSKIAEEILKTQGIKIRKTISLTQAIPSYMLNMKRVIFTDILKMNQKSPEFL
ncbi:MAG: hypothetical protein ACQ9MH_02695 [Nitrospinales bacterium]